MIPTTLTNTEAERLLTQGKARRYDTDYLTTPRATYQWHADRSCYARIAALPVTPTGHALQAAPPPPPTVPVATSTVLRRLAHLGTVLGIVGIVIAGAWWAVLYGAIHQAAPCFYSRSIACDWLGLQAQLMGYAPYPPGLLWGSGAVLLLSLVLEVCTWPTTRA